MKIDIVVSMMALRNTRIKSVGKLKAMQNPTGYNAELQNGDQSHGNKKLKIKQLHPQTYSPKGSKLMSV